MKSQLKDKLNEYLSFQDENGRSIMNTYGLYVVDIDTDSNIIFGCDPRRIQGYPDSESYYLYNSKAIKGNEITYMRISGELTPSMGKHGALVKDTSDTSKVFIEFDKVVDDASVEEKFKSLYSKYVSNGVPDDLGDEF